MCGVVGIFGPEANGRDLSNLVSRLSHRGPDDQGEMEQVNLELGHTRLSILDLSPRGHNPMRSESGRWLLTFNGEIYNFKELAEELSGYAFTSTGDTEVLLAALDRWGIACLDRLVGMFAFLAFDTSEGALYAVRDRFGVKPLYFAERGRTTYLASEIQALGAVGLGTKPDENTWASFLVHGAQETPERTFSKGVRAVPPGTYLKLTTSGARQHRWYDLSSRLELGRWSGASDDEAAERLLELLSEAVNLRFRADVPVGINLSGGLDSSALMGVVARVRSNLDALQVFTFACGAPEYDETPWVRQIVPPGTPLEEVLLSAEEVPARAKKLTRLMDGPFGGIPTIAYAKLFERARALGVYVLMDGQGMDEQLAGYDYYRLPSGPAPVVQGSTDPALRPDVLDPDFTRLAQPGPIQRHADRLLGLQMRDLLDTKLPRALRYNDRASMAASCELREPFLDHRLVEFSLSQPLQRKIHGDSGKVLLRRTTERLVPGDLRLAPKRPLQTPQREWLRGPLREWAHELILAAANTSWFDTRSLEQAWLHFAEGRGSNGHSIWQWISVGLNAEHYQEQP